MSTAKVLFSVRSSPSAPIALSLALAAGCTRDTNSGESSPITVDAAAPPSAHSAMPTPPPPPIASDASLTEPTQPPSNVFGSLGVAMNHASGTTGSNSYGQLGVSSSGPEGTGVASRRLALPRVRMAPAVVVGSLSPEIVRRTVRRAAMQVQFCYEQGLVQRPDLAGTVTIRFVIGPTGAVTTSQIASSTVPMPSVAECIVRGASRWTFPAPTGGGIVSVTQPFIFVLDTTAPDLSHGGAR